MSETTDVLRSAIEEIKRLRHENEVLKAKVEGMDWFAKAIGFATPPQIYTVGVDTATTLDLVGRMQINLEKLLKVEKVTGRLAPSAGFGDSQAGQAAALLNQQLSDRLAQMAQQGGQNAVEEIPQAPEGYPF